MRLRSTQRENVFPSFLRYVSAFHDDPSSPRLRSAFLASADLSDSRENNATDADFPSRRGFPSAFLPSNARISALTYLLAAKRCSLASSRSQPTIANRWTGCSVVGFADVSRRRRQFCAIRQSPPMSVFLRGGSSDARDPMHRDPFRCVLLPSIRGRVGWKGRNRRTSFRWSLASRRAHDPRISEGRPRRLDRLVRRSRSENSLPKTRCNEIGS